MNKFAKVLGNITETENGMVSYNTTYSKCLDYFFNVGALRTSRSNKNGLQYFREACDENAELALQILMWSRDIRGGSGERSHFRSILTYLDRSDQKDILESIIPLIKEVGRFDDYFVIENNSDLWIPIIVNELNNGNALAGKWAPRKGPIAKLLRDTMRLSPKEYRRLIVDLTKVVETQMCNKEWENIEYSKVPSQASRIYTKAFARHDEMRYNEWKNSDETKVNAGAIFPHEIAFKTQDESLSQKMWDQQPNYISEDVSFIPMIDVSGSMSGLPMEVAISLGIYCAERNKSDFKDIYLTFSETPKIHNMKGSLSNKIEQVKYSDWGMSTNIQAAFNLILDHAINNHVSQEDLPSTLIIFSDMQFNQAVSGYRIKDSYSLDIMKLVDISYSAAGYTRPNIVFWNLAATSDAPTTIDQAGTAMVSGFSPSLMKTLLNNPKNMHPMQIMLDTVNQPRYTPIIKETN